MAGVAYELLRDISKDEQAVFTQTYRNSEIRRKILACVQQRYEDYDRPDPASYNSNYPFIVAQYDGYRSACEDILRLLNVDG